MDDGVLDGELVTGDPVGIFEGDRLGLDVGCASYVEIESRNIMCVS